MIRELSTCRAAPAERGEATHSSMTLAQRRGDASSAWFSLDRCLRGASDVSRGVLGKVIGLQLPAW
jgi:hypothetical protein